MSSGQTPAESGNDILDSMVDELQPGTQLLHGQYTIVEFLNNGGFGITYTAKDSLDRMVVIKECFPNAFCRRSQTLVRARSRAHTSELKSVVKLFVNEARNLSKLQHPNIVGVHQVFEDNDTAYMAIDYIDGPDLLDLIDDQSVSFTPDEVIQIARKLISAVGYIHDNDLLHRDISPDNVLIDSRGEPVLIDFGAARVQASKQSRTLTALRVVKDGYSPQEFYIAGSEQGAWSDLYALGATLYHLISGQTPTSGQERLAALAEGREDPQPKLAGKFEGYPDGFLDAVDAAMNTLPKERLQSAEEWLELIAKANVRVIDEYREVDAPVAAPVDEASDALKEAVQSTVQDANESPPVTEPLAEPAQSTAPTQDDQVADALRAPIDDTPTRKGGMGKLLMGVASVAAVAVVAIEVAGPSVGLDGGITGLIGGNAAQDQQEQTTQAEAAAPVATSAPAEPEPTVAEAEAQPEAATEAAPEQIAAASTVPQATTTDSASDETEEPAASEEVAAVVTTPDVTPLEQQVAYSHWDISMPFTSAPRRANNANIALIKTMHDDAPLELLEPWVQSGAAIYSVNNTALVRNGDLANMILDEMQIDEDGNAYVNVTYKAAGSPKFEKGRLAIPLVRQVGLANGSEFKIQSRGGQWQTFVVDPGPSTFEVGDQLVRETSVNLPFGDLDAMVAALDALVTEGGSEAKITVMRGGLQTNATMQLATKQDG